MRHVTNSYTIDGGAVEKVQREGKEFLKFPIIALREMVLNYHEDDTKEYLSAEKIKRSEQFWDGAALVASHPPDRGDGQTARHPESWMTEKIGENYGSQALNGGKKLRTNGFIDIERAERFGGVASDVVNALENDEDVSVSAGYATMGDDETPGTFEGEQYDAEQGDLVPDHIAIWPTGQTGDGRQARCALEDGCGAPKLNFRTQPMTEQQQSGNPPPDLDPNALDDESAAGLGRWVLNSLNGFGNGFRSAFGNRQHDECSCDGDCRECDCDCATCQTVTDRVNAESGDEDGETTADSDGESDATDDPESADNDDESGGEPSGDQQQQQQQTDTEETNTMSDTDLDVDELAEQTPFDADAIEDMDSDQRATLESGIETDEETSTEADGGDEEPDSETVTVTETDTDDGDTVTVDAGEWDDMKQKVNSLSEREQERRSSQRERQKRIVVNARNDMTEDDVAAMDDDTLEHFADKYAGQAQGQAGGGTERVNYGAVPGGVDRTNSMGGDGGEESDFDAAVSREQYKSDNEDLFAD